MRLQDATIERLQTHECSLHSMASTGVNAPLKFANPSKVYIAMRTPFVQLSTEVSGVDQLLQD